MRHQAGGALFVGLQEDFLAAPDLFEVVVVADVGLQAVADDGAEVDEDPFARFLAFHAENVAAGLLDFVRDGVGEGAGLAVGGARSDDDAFELVGEAFGVEDLDVLGLDVFKGVDDELGEFFDVHVSLEVNGARADRVRASGCRRQRRGRASRRATTWRGQRVLWQA